MKGRGGRGKREVKLNRDQRSIGGRWVGYGTVVWGGGGGKREVTLTRDQRSIGGQRVEYGIVVQVQSYISNNLMRKLTETS